MEVAALPVPGFEVVVIALPHERWVESLPRTGVGKYQKNVLRERYKGYVEGIVEERAGA